MKQDQTEETIQAKHLKDKPNTFKKRKIEEAVDIELANEFGMNKDELKN